MTRLLVPIDFSPVSINAAIYAIQLAATFPKSEMVLYQATQSAGSGSDGTPTYADEKLLIANSLQMLEALQVKLFDVAPVPMSIKADAGSFDRYLADVVRREEVDLVVMGISPDTLDEEVLSAGAVHLVKSIDKPVLLVPLGVEYKPVLKAAVAVDLKDTVQTVPATELKKWVSMLKPELHVVKVGNKHQSAISETEKQEEAKLEELLVPYQSSFSYLHEEQFAKAMNHFVDEHSISVVVVFPKRHSLFEQLFATHHTKQLAYHSHVPVLALHT